MSIAFQVGVIIALALIVAVIVALTNKPFRRLARIARAISFVWTAGNAIVLFSRTYDENGWAVLFLLGVPVVAASLAVAADLAGRWIVTVTWFSAGAMTAWSLLTGLGTGLHFLGPSIIMIAAAAIHPPRPTSHAYAEPGAGA